MHELRRRAYLDAMGITSYLSRSPLPGAAQSRKLRVVRRSVEPDSLVTTAPPAAKETAPARPNPGIPVDLPDLSRGHTQRKPRVETGADNIASTAAGQAPTAIPRFSIVILKTGNWFWMEALDPELALQQNQVQLVGAMARVLGWSNAAPEVSFFRWPIHSNKQLDQDEAAARASFTGYFSRKLGADADSGLVFLGKDCRQWVDPDQLSPLKTLETVGTADMLRNPHLKKQAWRDLGPHAG